MGTMSNGHHKRDRVPHQWSTDLTVMLRLVSVRILTSLIVLGAATLPVIIHGLTSRAEAADLSSAQFEWQPQNFAGTPTALSCPSTTLCVAVDDRGNVVTSTDPAGGGASWRVTPIAPLAGSTAAGGEYGAFQGVSCPSTSFCVAFGYSNDPSAGAIAISTDPTGGAAAWTVTYVGGDGTALGAVSCPSTSLCVGVDAGDVVSSKDPTGGPTAWTVTPVDMGNGSTNSLTAISCPSTTLCIATDENGDILTSTDPAGGAAAWTVTSIDTSSALTAVSCPSTAFCVAAGGPGIVLTATDPTGGASAWTAASVDSSPLTAVSCPSTSVCVATDIAGNVLTSTDPTGGASAWTHTLLALNSGLTAISCPSTTLCVAVDGTADVLTSTDPTGGAGAWTTAPIPVVHYFQAISCPTPELCVAVDDNGNVVTSTYPAGGAGAWTVTPVDLNVQGGLLLHNELMAIACTVGVVPSQPLVFLSSTTLCVAVDDNGNVVTSTDPTGGASAWTVTQLGSSLNGNFTAISCPSTTLCVAVDNAGDVITSTDPTGGASAWTVTSVDTVRDFTGISCPSTTLCVGVDNNSNFGDVAISTDPIGGASAWTVTTIDMNSYFTGIACPNSGLCFATDGRSEIWLGQVPPPPLPPEPPALASAVATGSGSVSIHNPTCNSGDPVNCASGDFWQTFTDFDIPGRGPGLDLTRTYNSSNAATKGIFGNGWSSSYDQHLSFNADGSITFTGPDGSQVTATPNGSGGFSLPAWSDSTLTQNADGTYSFVQHATETFTFSSTGQLLSLADLNGDTTTLTYNASDQLATVTDSSGRTLEFTYGANGLVASVTDPLGRTMHYAYDAAGNLTSTTDAAGRTWSFSYDSSNRMLTMTDPGGGVVTNVYNASGQVVSQTDPAGLTTTWSYSGDNFSSAGGTTTITDPHGNVEVQHYVSGELVSLTKGYGTPQAATWSYTYDPNTLGVTSVTDPNGHTTTSTYDAAGNLLSSTDALGNTTSYTYNAFNEVLTVTSPLGEVTTNTYDAHGNLLSTTDPLGKTTTYTYGDTYSPGDLVSVTDPDGHAVHYTYDKYGNVVSTSVSPSSGVTDTSQSTYDQDGELVCTVSPDEVAKGVSCPSSGTAYVPGTTTNAYNAAGELTSSTNPLGRTTSYTYDPNGNQTSVTDPDGDVTTTTYDADNRVLSTTSGANGSAPSTISYGYDLKPGAGACSSSVAGATYCTTTTDANGQVSVEYYNALDELIETVRPGDITTGYTYDPAGNTTSMTDAEGRTTSYTYDADNRLVGITYSDGTTPAVAYAYNADGERTQMTDGTGTTSYTYDGDGRLTSETNGAGATVAYGYDPAGNLTSITYPSGKVVTRTYNGANELASVTDWNGETTSFSYDPSGNLVSTTYPNGDVVSSSYDAANELTATAVADSTTPTTPLASISYAYDPAGLVASATDAGALSSSETYTYDAEHRLISATGSAFAYDPAGNPTGLAGATQAFNAADELTAATSGGTTTSYTYNALGERIAASQTSGQGLTYSYDQAGHLLAVDAVTSSSGGGGGGGGTTGGGTTGGGSGASSGGGGGGGAAPTVSPVATSSPPPATILPTAGPTPSAPHPAAPPPSGVPNALFGAPATVTLPAQGTAHLQGGAGGAKASVVVAKGALPAGSVVSLYPVEQAKWLEAKVPRNDAYVVSFALSWKTPVGSRDKTGVPLTMTIVDPHVVAGDTIYELTSAGFVAIATATANGRAVVHFTMSSVFVVAAHLKPFVAAVTPNAGPLTGGTHVVIEGATFVGVRDVTFGARRAEFHVVSPTRIVAVAPPGHGAVPLVVSSRRGTGRSSGSDSFHYAPFGIYSVSPSQGSGRGGTSVTVHGWGLESVTAVRFGTRTARISLRTSATLVAVSPPGAGSVAVRVFERNSGSPISSTTRFEYLSPPESAPEARLLAATSTPLATFTYNGDGLEMSETTASGDSALTWDVASSVPELLVDGTTSLIYGPAGLPIEQVSGTSSQFFFHGQLGSTRALLDSSGAISATFSYSPYGIPTATTGTATTPIRFAGALYEPETGLYYLINRFYDPATAQFLSVDPAVAASHSAYGYVAENPVNGVDPSGMDWNLSVCFGGCIGWGSHGFIVGAGLGGSVQIGNFSVGAGGSITGTWNGSVTLSIPYLNVSWGPGHGVSVQMCFDLGLAHVSACTPNLARHYSGRPAPPASGRRVLQFFKAAHKQWMSSLDDATVPITFRPVAYLAMVNYAPICTIQSI